MKRKTGPPCEYFPFYVDAFLSSPYVMEMTPAERGAYVTLLAIEWTRPGCKLKNNDKMLAKLSGLGPKWYSKSGAVVKRAFAKRGQYIINTRLKREWDGMWQKILKCSDAGRASGKVRERRALQIKARTKAPLDAPLKDVDSMLEQNGNYARTRARALSLNSSLSLKEGESEGGENIKALSDGLLDELEGMRYSLVLDSLMTGGTERDLALIWLQYHKACPRGRSRWPAAKDFILPYIEVGLGIAEIREHLRDFKGMSDEPIFKALEALRSRAVTRLNGKDDRRFKHLGEDT